LAGLHDQDHAGPQDSDVAVVALESGDGGLVGSGDRIERFPGLHLVAKHAGLLGGMFVYGFCPR